MLVTANARNIPPELDRYLVYKGSIAIDGISLTIAELRGEILAMTVIPHTYRNTTLGGYRVGGVLRGRCPTGRHFGRQTRHTGANGHLARRAADLSLYGRLAARPVASCLL